MLRILKMVNYDEMRKQSIALKICSEKRCYIILLLAMFQGETAGSIRMLVWIFWKNEWWAFRRDFIIKQLWFLLESKVFLSCIKFR